MILESILGYKSIWRILELFAETPGKTLTRQELRRYTQLGNESLSSALNKLSLTDILIKIKEGKKESYRLNLMNKFTQLILEICKKEKEELRTLSYDIILILNDFVRRVLDKTNFVKKLILFGSVAKHMATKSSDIDLAIITTKKDVKQELIVTSVCDGLENNFKRKIQIHYFTEKEFETLRKKKNKLVEEILRDGIKIV